MAFSFDSSVQKQHDVAYKGEGGVLDLFTLNQSLSLSTSCVILFSLFILPLQSYSGSLLSSSVGFHSSCENHVP